MTLLDNIKKEQNFTLTENGALALNNTGNALVDLFSVSGAMRNKSDNDITGMFAKALIEDRLIATRLHSIPGMSGEALVKGVAAG